MLTWLTLCSLTIPHTHGLLLQNRLIIRAHGFPPGFFCSLLVALARLRTVANRSSARWRSWFVKASRTTPSVKSRDVTPRFPNQTPFSPRLRLEICTWKKGQPWRSPTSIVNEFDLVPRERKQLLLWLYRARIARSTPCSLRTPHWIYQPFYIYSLWHPGSSRHPMVAFVTLAPTGKYEHIP